ncbi:hypothetical protein [Microbacterium gubbeenense]|uniref:hypothetical protein n=1 Tax=Microbacterium gubbeenense TaxID=159896 RepID=UPI003F994606
MAAHLRHAFLPRFTRRALGHNARPDCLDPAQPANSSRSRLQRPHELLIAEPAHRAREVVSALAEQIAEGPDLLSEFAENVHT